MGRPDEREQADGRRQTRREGQAYQAAVEAVAALLIATGLGYWVDSRYDTSPWGLLLGTAAGFASFVHGLLKLGRHLHEPDAEQDTSEGKDR